MVFLVYLYTLKGWNVIFSGGVGKGVSPLFRKTTVIVYFFGVSEARQNERGTGIEHTANEKPCAQLVRQGWSLAAVRCYPTPSPSLERR